MNLRIIKHALIVVLFGALVAACGQKGPLYLPDSTGEVVTRPTAPEPGTAPNSSQSVDSPVAPASPAPEVTAPEDEDKDKHEDAPATPPPR